MLIGPEINFELLLPGEWNGKFIMGGGGGFVGSVQNQAQEGLSAGPTPLQRGYATAGTDTGHSGAGLQAEWALNNEERELNFGHRAVHLTADVAKSIIRTFYGDEIDYSYFFGCSRGGGQGMMESQRYPEDFDGIISAAPAFNWTGIGAGMVRNTQLLYPDADLSRDPEGEWVTPPGTDAGQGEGGGGNLAAEFAAHSQVILSQRQGRAAGECDGEVVLITLQLVCSEVGQSDVRTIEAELRGE